MTELEMLHSVRRDNADNPVAYWAISAAISAISGGHGLKAAMTHGGHDCIKRELNQASVELVRAKIDDTHA